MGLGDVFKANKNKELEERIKELESLLTPEHQEIAQLKGQIAKLKDERLGIQNEINNLVQLTGALAQLSEVQKSIITKNTTINNLNQTINKLTGEINCIRKELIDVEEEALMQSFGLYTPQYAFTHSDIYKDKLAIIREEQKLMIKKETAATGNMNWTVNGNAAQGKKMVKDMQKLLLRAFNGECDELVSKVKYNNFEASKKRIEASCTAISKLGTIMNISISEKYKKKKIEELTLAFEYAQKKQEEKEEQRQIKAQLREEAKLQREIEEERRKLEKEQTHYMNALAKLNIQLINNPDNQELLAKKRELEEKIQDAEKAIREVDYREANKRAGYVYVISNIGAFGNDVYKIGMTRRLDPQDRVDELGDASVPFNFDVHAMIFSDDAPKLENALHRAFEDRKINMVNHRREFFRVSLDEIKKVVKENYDKTVEFVDVPDAEQYRVSERMRSGIFQHTEPHSSYASHPTPASAPVVRQAAPPTVESISETIISIAENSITDFTYKPEETSDFMRLHIYTTDNRKIGAVKITKTDLAIQFRKIENGIPEVHDLSSAEDIGNYL